MNKSIVFVGLMILVLLGYIFNIDKAMSGLFLQLTSDARWSYGSSLTSVKNGVNSYFNQAQTLQLLESQATKNMNYKILYEQTKRELENMQQDMNLINIDLSNKTLYTKAVSYINLNDFSKVVLDKTLPGGKLYPLLTPQGYSAGIVRVQNGVSVAYLNPNEKANYAVFTGLTMAPGITSGMDDNGNLLIQHIPKWYTIRVNDEVITSGMDEIYPYGVRVGRVIGSKDLLNTKMAIVRPYASVISKKYFYIITKVNKTQNIDDLNLSSEAILHKKINE